MAFDVNRIDDVIHGRVRLGIVAYLATVETAEFNELKANLDTTAGNLSVHLRKLEEAGYVSVSKSIFSRKTLTKATITAQGRAAFRSYLTEVRALVDSHAAPRPKAKVTEADSSTTRRRRA